MTNYKIKEQFQTVKFVEINWNDIFGTIETVWGLSNIPRNYFDYDSSSTEFLFNDILLDWDDGFIILDNDGTLDSIKIINKYIFQDLYN